MNKITAREEAILFDLMLDVMSAPAIMKEELHQRSMNYISHLWDKHGEEETEKVYERARAKLYELLFEIH